MQLDKIEHRNKPDTSIPTQGPATQYNQVATSEIHQSGKAIHVIQKTPTTKTDTSDRVGIKTNGNVQRGSIAQLTVEIS